MTLRRWPLLAACLIVGGPAEAAAADDPPPIRLSLGEALRRALQANPVVGRARAEVEAAAAQTRGSFSLILPRLGATGGLIRNSKEVAFGSAEASVYLLAPTNRYRRGAIAVYTTASDASVRIIPFKGYTPDGFNAAISDQVVSGRAFFAVGPRAGGKTAAVYLVSPSGLTIVSKLQASFSASGNVLVQFLKLKSGRTVLVTAVAGQSKTIRAWTYDDATGKFVRDATLKASDFRLHRTTLRLR